MFCMQALHVLMFIIVCVGYFYVVRGLFIIDGKGLLRHICIHDNGVGRSVDETLRVINAIHFTEKFGEGTCIVSLLHVIVSSTSILSLVKLPI